jgi:hypothetical protein
MRAHRSHVANTLATMPEHSAAGVLAPSGATVRQVHEIRKENNAC